MFCLRGGGGCRGGQIWMVYISYSIWEFGSVNSRVKIQIFRRQYDKYPLSKEYTLGYMSIPFHASLTRSTVSDIRSCCWASHRCSKHAVVQLVTSIMVTSKLHQLAHLAWQNGIIACKGYSWLFLNTNPVATLKKRWNLLAQFWHNFSISYIQSVAFSSRVLFASLVGREVSIAAINIWCWQGYLGYLGQRLIEKLSLKNP